MEITTIGLDLAKNVFQVHGVNERGKAVLRKQLKRDQVAPFFANLPSCLIGIEACASAHHWARKLQALGHTVRLMAPQFVKPYVKSNKKNDAADAEAICEAVSRPSMRFVPIKNVEQQSVLASMNASESGSVVGSDDLGWLQIGRQPLKPHHFLEVAADGEVLAAHRSQEGGLAVLGRQGGESLGRVLEAEGELRICRKPGEGPDTAAFDHEVAACA